MIYGSVSEYTADGQMPEPCLLTIVFYLQKSNYGKANLLSVLSQPVGLLPKMTFSLLKAVDWKWICPITQIFYFLEMHSRGYMFALFYLFIYFFCICIFVLVSRAGCYGS